jgi:hypothetical protein
MKSAERLDNSNGWGTWIRTKINGVRVRESLSVNHCPNMFFSLNPLSHVPVSVRPDKDSATASRSRNA